MSFLSIFKEEGSKYNLEFQALQNIEKSDFWRFFEIQENTVIVSYGTIVILVIFEKSLKNRVFVAWMSFFFFLYSKRRVRNII